MCVCVFFFVKVDHIHWASTLYHCITAKSIALPIFHVTVCNEAYYTVFLMFYVYMFIFLCLDLSVLEVLVVKKKTE